MGCFATLRSLHQLVTYDAFNMAEIYLTQPLQLVAGSIAGRKWMSDDLYRRAASHDKRYHVIEGARHLALYDDENTAAEAGGVLAGFFNETL